MDPETKFATLFIECYQLKLCHESRRTVHPADIIAFFYSQVPGQRGNHTVFRDIAFEQYTRNGSVPTELYDLCKYFYARVTANIRRRTLRSLFLCFDIDVQKIKGIDIVTKFEQNTITTNRNKLGTPLQRLKLILNVLNGDRNRYKNLHIAELDIKLWRYVLFKKVLLVSDIQRRDMFADDETVMLKQVTYSGFMLMYASPRLKDHEVIVKAAVADYGRALRFASDRLKDDEVIVSIAITFARQHHLHEILAAASIRMQNSEGILARLAQRTPPLLQVLPDHFRDSKLIVMAAVSQYGFALAWASDRLKDDRTIVFAAFAKSGYAVLQYASSGLRDDFFIILDFVAQDWRCLRYASERLQNNVTIVSRALLSNKHALEFASSRLRDNEKFIFNNVINTENFSKEVECFKYVSPRLRDTETIVLQAVYENANALQWASDRLRDTVSIVQVASHNDSVVALRHASPRVRYMLLNPQ